MDLYHLLNRGVDGRKLFLDSRDYARFVHDLFEFNDTHPTLNVNRSFNMMGLRNPSSRELIVDIHGWCLMKNHYHLLVSEKIEGGITTFVRKLNIGYANYFNERYERKGALFQGRTKKIVIDSDAHFLHILNYIHFNPLDYLQGAEKWREGTITSTSKALEYMEKYKWSSYQDYLGYKNFPSILTTELFHAVFPNYKREATKCLTDREITIDPKYNIEE